jgi:hypothetical protein
MGWVFRPPESIQSIDFMLVIDNDGLGFRILNWGPETRNPKPQTRSHDARIRHPKPETRTPEEMQCGQTSKDRFLQGAHTGSNRGEYSQKNR